MATHGKIRWPSAGDCRWAAHGEFPMAAATVGVHERPVVPLISAGEVNREPELAGLTRAEHQVVLCRRSTGRDRERDRRGPRRARPTCAWSTTSTWPGPLLWVRLPSGALPPW